MKIKFIQNFIDILRGKQSIQLFSLFSFLKQQKKYKEIIKNLKIKVQNNQKIRVGFYAMYDSDFAAAPILELMQKDPHFDTFIVIIPDTSRGEENMTAQMEKTFCTLTEKGYKNIYHSIKDGKFQEFNDKADIIYLSNPYETMTNELYTIKRAINFDVLTFHVNYSFSNTKNFKNKCKSDFYNLLWKVFLEEKSQLKELKKHQLLKGANAEITGYCKMDPLSSIKIEKHSRKKIILAPHHTIQHSKNFLSISNFLEYADFFLELPKIYPNIDFIFRPHPLLFITLINSQIWTKEELNNYKKSIENIPNMILDEKGDYFELFQNSDGLIHDCGSFTVEYLYTDHPACYILRNTQEIKQQFINIGQQCIKHHYKAFNKTDIKNFIENIIINENDYKKEQRINFSNKILKVNYPNASQTIINIIKKEVGIN